MAPIIVAANKYEWYYKQGSHIFALWSLENKYCKNISYT